MKNISTDSSIEWLLKGDPAIQYQVYRDLLGEDRPDIRDRISSCGWGARFLGKRNPEGHWGRSFYQPKWISSHYTLLDLRNLCIDPETTAVKDTIRVILRENQSDDGGINPARSIAQSDVCVNGMFLNYASYFRTGEEQLRPIIDFILSQRMPDGGFNCRRNRSGAVHSSLHSTLCMVEGFVGYQRNGYRYRLKELEEARSSSGEFMLQHRLYLSDRTGEIIREDFLRFFYPPRWYYDILRALDYLQYAGVPYDPRMDLALDHLLRKRRRDGTWSCAKRPGQTHFDMERGGRPSRWNTLRALRVLRYYQVL